MLSNWLEQESLQAAGSIALSLVTACDSCKDICADWPEKAGLECFGCVKRKEVNWQAPARLQMGLNSPSGTAEGWWWRRSAQWWQELLAWFSARSGGVLES